MSAAARVEQPGCPPVIAEVEPRTPGDGEVGIEVLAAPITPLDLLCAGGESYFGRPAVPYTPGVQGVGLHDGRPVWFPTSAGMAPGDGSMAGHVTVAGSDLVPLPEGADPVLVAALGLSAVAAQTALVQRGELADGEQVIVLGGGGIVGQAAIQLARLAGARRVVAGVRSAGARARAEAAGADAVVALDTDDVGKLADHFAAAADGPVDLVLDPLYGVPAAAATMTLRPGGRLVNLGDAAGTTAPIRSALLRSRSLRILGYTNTELTTEDRARAVTHIADLVRAAASPSRTRPFRSPTPPPPGSGRPSGRWTVESSSSRPPPAERTTVASSCCPRPAGPRPPSARTFRDLLAEDVVDVDRRPDRRCRIGAWPDTLRMGESVASGR